MTKQEIQALIDAKIAGQGSAVDTGGALPAILSAIIGLIPDSPAVPAHIIQGDDLLQSTADSPLASWLTTHNVSLEDWEALINPEIPEKIIKTNSGEPQLTLNVTMFLDYDDQITIIAGGSFPEETGATLLIYYNKEAETITVMAEEL